jgi:putative addiction module component (TIGR02574 family)
MAQSISDIRREAMRLSPEERADLAGELIESLDADVDSTAEAAWQAEVSRRVRELDEGSVRLIPWTELRKRLGPA